MLNNFIYAQEKSLFLEQLGAGNILDEAIVFIEDTGEIWNHGTYFAGDCGFDPEVIREIQTAVANLKASKQDSISDLATIRIGASAGATAVQPETLNNYVPTNRTINGKSLTNNISLSASDVGAPAIGELNTTNTNVSDLTSKVSSLTTDYSAFKQVFSDNSDEYINTWGEVKNFLDGIKNTEDLNAILLGINTQLGNKADKSQLSGYLSSSGGTISGALTIQSGDDGKLIFDNTDTETYWGLIYFKQNGETYGRFGTQGTTDLSWNSNLILHSGNIGDFAFVPRTGIINNTDADTLLTNGVYLNATGNGSGNSNFPSTYSILMTFTQNSNYAAQLSVAGNAVHIRRKIDAWSDWKTIAFTDSDITGYAAGLKHSNGTVGAVLNSSGNVGIGTSSPTQKLDVRGNQYITGYIYADGDLNSGQWLRTYKGVALGTAHTLTFNNYSIISNAELSFSNITTTDISTGIKAAIKAGLMQINDIIGHRIFLGNNSAGTASNQPFSICTYSSVSNYAPANVTELFRVDPTGAVTINGSLSVTGNIISSDEYLGASNVLDNPEYASYPSSGSSMEMHSDIRNFVNNGTVVRKDGKLYVKDNPFAPVTTHWLDIFSDPTEIGGYNYSGPVELDLYPDRFYDFTNSLFISSIKINSIPGWGNPGLISHNIVRFRPTNTAFSLTLPSDIYWADGKPFEVDDNDAVYEISFIVRNGGVITATWTKFTQA